MRVRGSSPVVAAATILQRGGMPMATPSEVRRRQQEYIRDAEEAQRRNGVPPFKNGAEMMQAWRDLFDSDEELEEFARYVQRTRQEERARYRD
jgi:hypothetical protein